MDELPPSEEPPRGTASDELPPSEEEEARVARRASAPAPGTASEEPLPSLSASLPTQLSASTRSTRPTFPRRLSTALAELSLRTDQFVDKIADSLVGPEPAQNDEEAGAERWAFTLARASLEQVAGPRRSRAGGRWRRGGARHGPAGRAVRAGAPACAPRSRALPGEALQHVGLYRGEALKHVGLYRGEA